jgi:hypothetical protein
MRGVARCARAPRTQCPRATPTLGESTPPRMGIPARTSAAARAPADSPCPSAPTSRAVQLDTQSACELGNVIVIRETRSLGRGDDRLTQQRVGVDLGPSPGRADGATPRSRPASAPTGHLPPEPARTPRGAVRQQAAHRRRAERRGPRWRSSVSPPPVLASNPGGGHRRGLMHSPELYGEYRGSLVRGYSSACACRR